MIKRVLLILSTWDFICKINKRFFNIKNIKNSNMQPDFFGTKKILIAENWKLKTDNWQLTTDNWELTTENWKLKTENWQLKTDNWQLTTDNWKLRTENWKLRTENWQLLRQRLATCDLRHFPHKKTPFLWWGGSREGGWRLFEKTMKSVKEGH